MMPVDFTIHPFEFAPTPHIKFGWGIRHTLAEHLRQNFMPNFVVITSKTLAQPGQFTDQLLQQLNSTAFLTFEVSGEPSPELVDDIVKQCPIETSVVVAIGGGSVMDAAKAIAGLIPSQTSVMDYLEGVGKGLVFDQLTTPFLAVPTTAGTGSETTKNSVLSKIGHFKKSFRDNRLIAKEAWLDPELLESCPKSVLYATGLDAFTQLLESYTTIKSNPMTDALAWQGMQYFNDAFSKVDSNDPALRQEGLGNLMLAASLSGITLANAGLGAVHGLAGPVGAFFEAPHGIVCAKLLAPITKANISAMQTSNETVHQRALAKYQQVSQLLHPDKAFTSDTQAYQALIDYLEGLSTQYAPQGLSQYGLNDKNLSQVINNCRSGSMLGNPIVLSDKALLDALLQSLDEQYS